MTGARWNQISITEGFQRSEEMHQLRFTQLVGDFGDSSVFYSVALNVTYGRRVKKVECANHAVKLAIGLTSKHCSKTTPSTKR